MSLEIAICEKANACIVWEGLSIDNSAAKPRKTIDVGERSRVAASETHGWAEIYGCKPRGGGRESGILPSLRDLAFSSRSTVGGACA